MSRRPHDVKGPVPVDRASLRALRDGGSELSGEDPGSAPGDASDDMSGR
ncbi:MAG: hypothetical protein U0164_14185 [Gemmatimonadaceae bacterium]